MTAPLVPAPIALCRNRRTGLYNAGHSPNPDTGRCRYCAAPATVYDDVVDLYETAHGSAHLGPTMSLVLRLLPPGGGELVDLGCGPGLLSGLIAAWPAHGYRVTGVDASGPMTERAAKRLHVVLNRPADATGIPDASVDVVLSTWTHTDLPWAPMIREALRILKPGGAVVYVGGHPAFTGPHAQRGPHGGAVMFPGYYGAEEWTTSAPGFTPGGLRAHVGQRHVSMAEFLRPIFDDEWEGRSVMEEPAELPTLIAMRAFRAL